MNTITKLILVTLLAIVLITFGIAAVSASDEVEIVSVTGRCNRGDVLAKMTLFNYSDQDRSPGVYLRLYQLIPDSNEPQLVDQVSFDYLILFAGEEGAVNHRFLEPDIDPKAIDLWLEGGCVGSGGWRKLPAVFTNTTVAISEVGFASPNRDTDPCV